MSDYTWDRLSVTWKRLLSNYTLDIDELGGAADAVGIVSIFALMQADAVDAVGPDGLLVLKERPDTPVHQYADMAGPPRGPRGGVRSRASDGGADG